MTTRMKVTISVPGRFHGFHLAREIAKRHEVRLVTTFPRFEVEKYVSGVDLRSIFLIKVLQKALPRSLSRGWKDLSPLLARYYDSFAARQIEEDCNLFVGWSSWALRSLQKAKRLEIPTVLERGSSHILEQTELLNDEYARFGFKFEGTHPLTIEQELNEYSTTDYLSVLSLYSKKTFLARGFPADRIIHIPLGVDVKRFKAELKKDKTFRIIYVGALSLRKGVYYLVKAFSELGLPGVELWLVGDLVSEAKNIFRGLNLTNVRFFGNQPEEKLNSFYSQGNVFVMPSIEDGFGMVFTQAMACGLPVIGTENSGIPDIVRNGNEGFILPIRDVSALKEKLLWCFENQEACREMGKHALQRITNFSTWETYGEKMSEKYGEITSPKLRLVSSAKL